MMSSLPKLGWAVREGTGTGTVVESEAIFELAREDRGEGERKTWSLAFI